MNSAYIIVVLVGFVSFCYAANPLSCYQCQSDTVSNRVPGCFDPFNSTDRNVVVVNCVSSSIYPTKIGVKGLSLITLEDFSTYHKAAPDFECGILELTATSVNFKQITRGCFLKEGGNECESAGQMAANQGFTLTQCKLCEDNSCNSAANFGNMVFTTLISSVLLFIVL